MKEKTVFDPEETFVRSKENFQFKTDTLIYCVINDVVRHERPRPAHFCKRG